MDTRAKPAHNASLIAPPRDHIGLIVQPQTIMLLQDCLGRFEILPLGDDRPEFVILDLGHIDRGVPGGEQGGGADRSCLSRMVRVCIS